MEEQKTIEQWAEDKGFLPAETEASVRGIGMRAVKAKRPNPLHWKFVAAKAARLWPQGKEVTEEEFDEAVAEAAGVALR